MQFFLAIYDHTAHALSAQNICFSKDAWLYWWIEVCGYMFFFDHQDYRYNNHKNHISVCSIAFLYRIFNDELQENHRHPKKEYIYRELQLYLFVVQLILLDWADLLF